MNQEKDSSNALIKGGGKDDDNFLMQEPKQQAQTLESKQERIMREIEEEAGQMGRVQTCRFFLKHSVRDVKRRKFHFCLAFLSVFIVVLSTLVIHTVVAKGPIIFMALGQEKGGAFDGFYQASHETARESQINTYW